MNTTFATGTNTSSTLQNSTSIQRDNTFYNVWNGLFFVVLALNFVGNCLVIMIIVIDHKFHSTMNFLFVNMALSDFLSGVFALLWYIVNNITPEWRSEWVCRIVAANTVTVLSGFVSIFTLTAITLERYNAIVSPLEHRMSWFRFKLMLILIWTFAIVCSLPYFILINVIKRNGQTHCTFLQPPGKWRQLMTSLSFIFMYALPNTVICIAYAKIVKHLWFNKENDTMPDSHQALLRSRKKITKLLGSVLVVFNICAFPNSLADFMLTFGNLSYGHKFPQIAFLTQLLTTCVNPLIFFVQSKQFRRRLMLILCCEAKKLNSWGTLYSRSTGRSAQYKRTQSTSNIGQTSI